MSDAVSITRDFLQTRLDAEFSKEVEGVDADGRLVAAMQALSSEVAIASQVFRQRTGHTCDLKLEWVDDATERGLRVFVKPIPPEQN